MSDPVPRGVKFGTLHSYTDLKLILQKTDAGPAPARINRIPLRGASGSVDLTEALGIGVTYDDRTMRWTFAVKPGEVWTTTRRAVANALNGQAFNIYPDDENGWYYAGRCTVESYASDNLLKQIVISAVCDPYIYKSSATHVTGTINTTAASFTLNNSASARGVLPAIVTDKETVLSDGTNTATIAAGTRRVPSWMYLQPFSSVTFTAKTTSGTGSIDVYWREAQL